MLGTVPTQDKIIAERFFDEAGGMQLILHSPWGGRINRAWGLALRKRFCVSFDRELQAAATDDGICISLVEQHSFPLSDVFLDAAPGDSGRQSDSGGVGLADVRQSLALERDPRAGDPAPQRRAKSSGGAAAHARRRSAGGGVSRTGDVPGQSQRSGGAARSSAGQRNHGRLSARSDGRRRSRRIFSARIESGAIETLAIDTPAPSPMAHEILNANPYAFLDDAPLGRAARAGRVAAPRRSVARPEFGRLDPAAIEEVRKQAWPEVRNRRRVA